MKRRCFLLLALYAWLPCFSGCVSRSQARAQAQAAFLAGQQQGLQQQAQQQQHPGPSVTVAGPVRYTVIPWTSGLTVARAIIAAEYLAPSDPREIVVLHNGQSINVDPKRLLNGDDPPLEAGDVLQLKP